MRCCRHCQAIQASHTEGLACLMARSHTPPAAIDPPGRERLRELLQHSPRQFGQDRSVWTSAMVAEVSFALCQ